MICVNAKNNIPKINKIPKLELSTSSNISPIQAHINASNIILKYLVLRDVLLFLVTKKGINTNKTPQKPLSKILAIT